MLVEIPSDQNTSHTLQSLVIERINILTVRYQFLMRNVLAVDAT